MKILNDIDNIIIANTLNSIMLVCNIAIIDHIYVIADTNFINVPLLVHKMILQISYVCR